MNFYLLKFTVTNSDGFTFRGFPIENGDHEKIVNQMELIGLEPHQYRDRLMTYFKGSGNVGPLTIFNACMTCKATGMKRTDEIIYKEDGVTYNGHKYITCPDCEGTKIKP